MRITSWHILLLGCGLSGSVLAAENHSEVSSQKDETSPSSTLWREWETAQPNALPFKPYKENYLLFSTLSNANNAPTSPNPSNQVPFSNPLQNRELKFQVSGKSALPLSIGNGNAIWLAYTQQSFWQAFDGGNSRPFRESNYEPEIILSHRFSKDTSAQILNLGLVHQSNGQSLPRSRSWNRLYLQAGFERAWNNGQLIVEPKLWLRTDRPSVSDDNPDITHYLGHGEIHLRYIQPNQFEISSLLRAHSVQLGFGYRLAESFYLQLQYFNGYGESLIDYNHRHSSVGIGLSLPY